MVKKIFKVAIRPVALGGLERQILSPYSSVREVFPICLLFNRVYKLKSCQEVVGLGSIRCFAGVAKGLGDVRRIRKGRCRPASCIRGLAQREPSAAFPGRPHGKADLSKPPTSAFLSAKNAIAN